MQETSKIQQAPSDFKPPTHFIGIGASAGGLEALQLLLKNLPTKTGACFVIVQHLSPDFKSMMVELLSKHTSMTVENVQDGVLAKPNTIYLLPPKKSMIVAQGELLLSDKVPDAGLSLPIDVFFRSLSEDQQYRAIGIVLSGTGTDGSRGIKALKEAGALVIAQDPESAKFDGMPNSAINTGIVDMILRPEDMGEKLAEYIKHPLVSGDAPTLSEDIEGSQDVMGEIFTLLRDKSDIDFSKYKPSTIARRIERRMTIQQVNSLHEYLTLLFKDPHEVSILGKELLIGVTRFFRDDEAFNVMREKVIPNIVEQSKNTGLIRVWVAACSTGEEAYSIAILLQDELSKQGINRDVKIFATDINSDAISEASSGVYSDEIIHDVDSAFLPKYFSKRSAGGYQITQQIRNMVVFATHNMIVDPPFSNIDLLTCRNVLIYFKTAAQKRVMSSFHFALNKTGYLFLGSSENLGELAPHFTVVNDRQRIFTKISDKRLPVNTDTTNASAGKRVRGAIPSVASLMKSYRGQASSVATISFANETLITQYVPPCILLNDELQAMHVYGDVSPFTQRLPPGRISTDINDMVNPDISIAVMSAIQRAKQQDTEVFYSDMHTNGSAGIFRLNLRVKYVKEHDIPSAPRYYWVIFEVQKDADENAPIPVAFDPNEQARQRIEDLEMELKFSKENLQVTVEELETTNEELQSANEELMSANEELQSTNEELQSVNEELYTVNSEYQEKITEISQANGDLDEVLSLSKIGIIFLDENMLIRRYTEAVKAYVNLREHDLNRPLHHISKNIRYDDMLEDVSKVFETGEQIEKEIKLSYKKVLRVTINPYNYDTVSQLKGIAIVFADVSQVKYTELGMSAAYKHLRSSINNALDMLDNHTFQSPLSVLLLDDSETQLAIWTAQIDEIQSYEVRTYQSATIEEALALIEKYHIDVCISDFYLKDETAIDFIDALRAAKLDLPIIVATGDMDESLNPLLFSHGALDLIDKVDINPALLDRSIRYAIRRKQIDAQIEGLIPDSVDKIKASDK
ncbi:chemotaxis protein CheB [Glaciecola siphonariae]|uniref:Chemotaxis protein CheB n=1 Tax=Glaciecola siphonariae TaxID=521012 RepID=A0ABV9LXL8_9ALTE